MEKKYQIIPFDESMGIQNPAPEEFSTMKEAEDFLDRTSERWEQWNSIQIVNKQTGKVEDVW